MTTTTDIVQNILDRLHGIKSAGLEKWMAFCPVHEADGNGHARSLSIGQGDDGRALLHCFAGCESEKILAAVGLHLADLMPPKAPAAHKPATRIAKPARVYALPCLAAQAIARQVGGTLAGYWPYLRADGSVALIELRFNLPLPADAQEGDKPDKACRPIHPNGDGWSIGDPPEKPLPAYNLTAAHSAKRVYLVEGPGKVDEMTRLGLTATTSAHGCKSAHFTDWRFLAGKELIGLPDNDDGGQKYVHKIGAITTALDPPARVKIVRLPGLPPGGDIMEYLEIMDAHTSEEIAENIESLANAAPPWVLPTEAEIMNAKNESETERGVFVRLSDVTPQPVRWLWPGRFALGKLSIIAGNAGLGKSCVCLDLAARVSRGDGWPDCLLSTSEPGGVVLLSAEDDLADTIRPRLDAAGADVSRILALTTIKRFDPECGREVFESFNLAIHLLVLESGIAQVENCRLVIIDVLAAYLGRVDSHNNAEVRGLLAPLSDLAARHGVAVIGISHLNKGQGDALARVMGSVAFGAAPRAVYAVAKDADDPSRRLFLPAKNNLAPDISGLAYRLVPVAGGVPCVVWEPGPVAIPADDALAPLDRQRGPEPENREEAQSWLADFLTGGPRPAEECLTEAARVGITRSTLRRAKTAAGVVAEKQGYGGPWMWRLPGHDTPPQTLRIEGAHEGAQVPLF